MVRAVDGPAGFDELLADSRRNALILGPGAGVSDAVRQQVLMALATRRGVVLDADALTVFGNDAPVLRSEEHTSELQSLMRISYAVFCLKKKNKKIHSVEHGGNHDQS